MPSGRSLRRVFRLGPHREAVTERRLARRVLLAQPMPMQILVGAVALAVLWVLWIVLRVTLVAFRAAFRGL